jgi:hypothetical protein
MNKIIPILTGTVLTPAILLILTGCWTPYNANVQPAGEPRLIQSGLKVDCVKVPATVQAVDVTARTVTLQLSESDKSPATYKAAAEVENLGSVQAGNKVSVNLTKELAIYLLDNGKLPGGGTAETLGVNAKVLRVESAYRLVTLEYPNGQSEKVKVGLEAKIEEFAPGDSVVVKPLEVTKIRIK